MKKLFLSFVLCLFLFSNAFGQDAFDSVSIKDADNATRTLKIQPDGSADINVQDQTTRMLDLKFINPDLTSFTTLSATAAKGDYVVTVTSVTGYAVGAIVGISNPSGIFYFGEVIGISVNDLTLDTQLDNEFPSGSNIFAGSTSMNVAGTMASPVSFQIGGFGAGTEIEIDITRIMGNMTNSAVMTDETFGGLSILTNGIVLRVVDGETQNIWNLKSNGAIALLCYDATYPEKFPSADYAFRFRNTFAGQSKHGVTVRLRAGDTLEVLVQDDLTGLTDFQMMAQGHIVED